MKDANSFEQEPLSGRPSLLNFKNTIFYDNSLNKNLHFAKSFQTFLGCVVFEGKVYMIFEHFESSLGDVLKQLKNRGQVISEEIIFKILKYSMEVFTSCKQTKMFYPSFCLENVYVPESNGGEGAKTEGKRSSSSREVKYKHPFLDKSFFYQIERKNHGDEASISRCKWAVLYDCIFC